jgi:hypothetical protein
MVCRGRVGNMSKSCQFLINMRVGVHTKIHHQPPTPTTPALLLHCSATPLPLPHPSCNCCCFVAVAGWVWQGRLGCAFRFFLWFLTGLIFWNPRSFVALWSRCGCPSRRCRHGRRHGPVGRHKAMAEDQLVLQC